MNEFPNTAKVVVIGGGVVGTSTAYHLAKFGWKNIILLERDQLTSGTTWHAAGLVSQLGPSAGITKIRKYSFCLLYTSPSPRDRQKSRMPSSA